MTPRSKIQAPNLRAINRARIISLLRRNPGSTRAELSRSSGLSKATISTIVTELLDEGFLRSDADGDRQRDIGLSLNGNAGVAVGIELSPDECRAILSDMEARPLKHIERPMANSLVDEVTELILEVTAEFLSDVETRCLGLAVAVPGPTDVSGRSIVFSESLGWTDVPLAQKLEERLSFPVSVINRPRAGLLGEHWYGAGVGVGDLVYVSISTGIGAGILIGGRLFTGSNGNAGELGHTISLISGGARCPCGNRGCLETVASIPAIARSVTARLESQEPSLLSEAFQETAQLHYQDIIAAARAGDALVLDELKEASRHVGIAVANMINLFNPKLVIIGGRLADAGEIVLNTIRETAQRRAFSLCFSDTKIVRNALGADSVCIGACSMVVHQYLSQIEPAFLSMAI